MEIENNVASMNFDAVISSPDESVDMKSGLDTLQGISDATRKIGETLLTKKVPQRLHHGSAVRTKLKQSFKGSYGQIFSLEFHDSDLKKELRKLGRENFVELMNYFIGESLYEINSDLSEKSQNHLEKLGNVTEDLIKNLRTSCMENIHEVPVKFGFDVKLNYRKTRSEKIEIGSFTKETALVLQAEPTDEEVEIRAAITRLNINTGNGRLKPEESAETYAFGFSSAYAEIRMEAKKIFSENLNYNNGIPEEKWKVIRLRLNPVRLKDRRIIKYIVIGYFND
ncbi:MULTISPECIES: hypothetical protein [unclassified Xanthomonas]|uniref:hypothetical protein n=1 Tax=unclassified Xanthomonas TaxID=2643310 RepID=UPI002882FF40|nr:MULTISPECIES: hypothetical protein [unclassified Xanthomonas]